MFTQILVAIDGSKLAERVLPCVEQLAKAGQRPAQAASIGPCTGAPALCSSPRLEGET